jgi:trehalose-6-phosphate synthase
MAALAGITLSMKAYRNVLRENEKYRSCMVLVQVANSSAHFTSSLRPHALVA